MKKEDRLKIAIGLSLSFMMVEVVGGYFANSIAIFSDAAHLLTDIAGFAIALLAAIASTAPGTKHLTFGLARAEVFGALLSVVSLWIVTVVLLYAAYFRAVNWFEGHPDPIDGRLMCYVAIFGVFVNICLGYVFQEEHGSSLHPGHSHDHDHGAEGGGCSGHGHARTSYAAVSTTTSSSKKSAESGGCCGGHDHSHQHATHDHDHGHGHDHGHSESTSTVKVPKVTFDHGHDSEHTPLVSSSNATTTATTHAAHGGHDVNIEAAYLHVLADLIQSIGVAIAGLLIWTFPGWEIIDPVCTLIFSFVALGSTINLLKKVGMILFEGTPSHVSQHHTIS